MWYTKAYMKVAGGHRKKWIGIGGISLVVVSACVSLLLLRVVHPMYSVEPEMIRVETQPNETPNLSWPAYGQAAIATQSHGIVATHGDQTPHPTASTAKIITMMAILEKRPLQVGEQGPLLVMTPNDVASYDNYVARNGTNTPVHDGLELTQYQALQSILLASSNNMSDTLAVWAFGSIEEYHTYANEMVQKLGAMNTVIAGDASGLSAETTSTARDMAIVSLAALKNPVIAEIAAQQSADIPFAGTIQNSNALLQHSEIVGLKVGETVEAGGNFLLAANHASNNHSEKIVVVVFGAPLARIAVPDSYTLYQSAKQYITHEEAVARGAVLARYVLPNGTTREAVADQSIAGWLWAGEQPDITVTVHPVTQNTQPCASVGSVSYGEQSVSLRLAANGQSC